MKALRWVWVLAAAVVLLTAAFFFVDARTKKEKERQEAGAARQLFSINPDLVTRITIDNEEGHFAFDWSDEAGNWVLTSADRFNLNPYAVSGICNYFCNLASEKTVAFDCDRLEPYGLDDPVTVKLYTTQTGDEHPYILYVGDNTPTFDNYYVMVEGSKDVFTINYTAGSMFCVAKNTLKNMYLFDTYGTLVQRYRIEKDGQMPLELQKSDSGSWRVKAPADFAANFVQANNLTETLVRTTVSAYIEDDPDDLAQYGLDKPHTKLWIEGRDGNQDNAPMREEIWLGANISDRSDETEMYGYFVNSKQVFRIKRADVSFINENPINYIQPYCYMSEIVDVDEVEIDMGDVYPLHAALIVDSVNNVYHLNGQNLTELGNDDVLSQYQAFYRALTTLSFTDLALDAVPEGDPAITIRYKMKDGTTPLLEFIPFEENNYYLVIDGVYTGKTIRLNRFTGDNKITRCYEALQSALKRAG